MRSSRSALNAAPLAVLIASTIFPASLVAQGTQSTPATQAARAGRAWRVTIAGDLDAVALADRLGGVLQDAHERHASLVLLELGGNRWRIDVVWAMAQVIQESPTPVAALLQDTRDRRVGAGQLMLATLCEQSWIDPDTRIVSTQQDDLASWADKNTDWERVQRELAAAIWLKLDERRGPVLLARPLVARQETVWLGPNRDTDASAVSRPSIVTRGEPNSSPGSDDSRVIIEAHEDGTFSITIDPDQLLALKLITGIERRPAVVLRSAGARPTSPRTVALDSGLGTAHASAWRLLQQLDAIVISLERLTGRDQPGDQSRDQRDRRDIDAQLRRGVQAHRRGRSKLDTLLLAYPEIPNMPRPAGHPRDFPATHTSLVKRYEKLQSRQ